MSDLVHKAHADVGLTLLRNDAALTVYDGAVPSPPSYPYVLVYVTVARPRGTGGAANALDAQAVTYVTTYTCHCVGRTAEAARAVAMRVDDALNNVRPTITTPAARQCGLIGQDDLLAPERNESAGGLVMDSVGIYSFISAPG